MADGIAGFGPKNELQSSYERARDQERARVSRALRARDAEVRAHEAAHVAAGGAHIRGAAAYSYQRGPDGRMYAIGGEVGIDLSPAGNDPAATIAKMRAVRAAALAPADPSGPDRRAAAAAIQIEARARAELARMLRAELDPSPVEKPAPHRERPAAGTAHFSARPWFPRSAALKVQPDPFYGMQAAPVESLESPARPALRLVSPARFAAGASTYRSMMAGPVRSLAVFVDLAA